MPWHKFEVLGGRGLDKLLKIIAVLCALSVTLVTGSLYVRGIRDDMREQKQLNQRLREICGQAQQSDWTEPQRSEFLKRHCGDQSL